jgi:hypothetical protein
LFERDRAKERQATRRAGKIRSRQLLVVESDDDLARAIRDALPVRECDAALARG